MWDKQTAELGVIKEKSNHIIKYVYTPGEGETMEVNRVQTSCGCSSGNWNPQTKTVSITYTAAPVPVHMKQQNKDRYNTNKEIIVHAVVNGIPKDFVLNFTATVIL